MKKQKTLKALVLSLAMAFGMLLPMTMQAQSDGFLRDDSGYTNRDGGGYDVNNQQFGANSYNINNQTFGSGNGGYDINNQTFGENLPLGSGLLIMVAAGGAYVLARRKHE